MTDPVSLAPDAPIAAFRDVHKRRGTVDALQGFSLEVAPGRTLGLIGPNGAGKTTAIQLLLGLLRPDRGTVEAFGRPALPLPAPLRRRIGFLAERSSEREYPDLSLRDLLAWHRCYFDEWDPGHCEELIQRLGAIEDRRLWRLSEGQRRRCEMVLALAHRPELVVLDDPALGLDALARRELLWATLDLLRERGATVLFTSHVLQDVERVVDDVCLLDGGRVRFHGALDTLLEGTKRLVLDVDAADVEPLPGEVQRFVRGRDLVVVTTACDDALTSRLSTAGALLRVDAMNLEEIFCAVVGKQTAPATEVVR